MVQIFTHQEDLHKERRAAMNAGNMDRVLELNAMIDWEPEVLDHAKKSFGIEAVRNLNYNTKTAVKKYGKDWLL